MPGDMSERRVDEETGRRLCKLWGERMRARLAVVEEDCDAQCHRA
jgi:hypothetical protein